MDNILLEADIVSLQYAEPELPVQQQAVAQGGGGAVTGITSGTITVTDPGDGTRNIELPQALGTGASPTFSDVNITDDLSVTDLATVGRLLVGSGSTINRIQTGTVNADPGSIGAQARGSVDVTITGVAVGDILLINPPDGLNAGLVYGGCRVTAANTVRIYLANLTAAAIDDGSLTYSYIWFDMT